LPHFYFNVRTRHGLVINDRDGISFRDLREAVADAGRGVSESVADATPQDVIRDFAEIEVTDEAGRVVATVPFPQRRWKEK